MVDIRIEEQQYRKQLEDYYKREDTLTADEIEHMRWIESYLEDIELTYLNETRY